MVARQQQPLVAEVVVLLVTLVQPPQVSVVQVDRVLQTLTQTYQQPMVAVAVEQAHLLVALADRAVGEPVEAHHQVQELPVQETRAVAVGEATHLATAEQAVQVL
jgi:hypothetical protein